MAVPKHNASKAKTRSRRAHKDKLDEPEVGFCPRPSCYAPKRPHRVCPECGHYQTNSMDESEQIVEIWGEY